MNWWQRKAHAQRMKGRPSRKQAARALEWNRPPDGGRTDRENDQMSDQKQSKPNTGALFGAADVKPLREGPVNVNGEQDDSRFLITQKKLPDGKVITQIWRHVGGAKVVEEANKRGADSPDLSGGVDLAEGSFYFSGWKKTSKNGNAYTSVSLRPKDGEQQQQQQQSGGGDGLDADYDEEIPF